MIGMQADLVALIERGPRPASSGLLPPTLQPIGRPWWLRSFPGKYPLLRDQPKIHDQQTDRG
jgi:hypothetical protein